MPQYVFKNLVQSIIYIYSFTTEFENNGRV
jgi:hypothetical protein